MKFPLNATIILWGHFFRNELLVHVFSSVILFALQWIILHTVTCSYTWKWGFYYLFHFSTDYFTCYIQPFYLKMIILMRHGCLLIKSSQKQEKRNKTQLFCIYTLLWFVIQVTCHLVLSSPLGCANPISQLLTFIKCFCICGYTEFYAHTYSTNLKVLSFLK